MSREASSRWAHHSVVEPIAVKHQRSSLSEVCPLVGYQRTRPGAAAMLSLTDASSRLGDEPPDCLARIELTQQPKRERHEPTPDLRQKTAIAKSCFKLKIKTSAMLKIGQKCTKNK